VLGDAKVDDAPAVVSEDDQDEEDPKARRGYGEEVDRDQVAEMVSEKRPPGLRGRETARRYEAGDGALGDVDAELQEFAVDTRGAPDGIRGGHLPDQGGDLDVEARGDLRVSGAAGEPGPILAEAAALPAQDGIGRDDH
jgi:hypothetical protein